MKKVLTEVAITVVSPFAALLMMAIVFVHMTLLIGGVGIILPLVGWADGHLPTIPFLIYAAGYGGLYALSCFYEHLPMSFEKFFEKAWQRGMYVNVILMIGGVIVFGIITNFF